MNDAFFKTAARAPAFGFHGAPLDRVSERRDDDAMVAALRARPDAKAVLIAREMPILPRGAAPLAPYFPLAEVERLGGAQFEALLGIEAAGAPVFAALLPDGAVEQLSGDSEGFLDRRQLVVPGRDDLALTDLRSIAVQGLVGAEALAVLGQAKAILSWHARHGFCANCGAETRPAAAGWRRECDVCKAQHFPRTDPVVIMLALNGERCLLGRQSRWPEGMYSCLAGFVEPGETIEEAVRREIREESGIACGEVAYLASQPWPFPSSLMIGCFARAASRDIVVDDVELEDARWFERAEVMAMFDKRHPEGLTTPMPMAIAHHILRVWAEGD
ncbi:MAG: NAD(+) diphosphatase [Roseiarcus sp.]|jgi:NAD+ diphosphatase